MGITVKKSNPKKSFFSSIDLKITLLIVVVALVAPALAIYYFYIIANSVIPESLLSRQNLILETTAIMIIILIASTAGIIGLLFSRSISKPLKELYNATQEVKKGNFEVRTDIRTNDEIGELSRSFNSTVAALSRMNEERKEIEEAKTEFLSITSHELRTPMTPMKAQLQMLENEYFGKLTQKQKDGLAIITRNADRLDKIIADFLDISRIESARLKFSFIITDLKETILETAELMRGFANEKNIKLDVKIDNIPKIEADPDRISQVLRNLINNAIKFSPENSNIQIAAKVEKEHILFSVKDYGPGLTRENQIKVFEPFYQVEKTTSVKYGGSGLGLAICRGIVEAQKGKIWVESKPGEGCTFYFTIPMQPVKKIEPIKLLFSQRSNLERKIQAEFETMLGPLGVGEFNELKNKNALWKDDIYEYIDSLTEQYIITDDQGKDFKNRIGYLFGVETEVKPEECNTPLIDNQEEEMSR